MTLYAQQGYGKADKLNQLGSGGQIGGVILSPADEGPVAMQQTARDMRFRGVSTLLDPQTYVYSIPDAVARCHAQYGLNFGPLTWGSLAPGDIQAHVAAVLNANAIVATDGPIIAPCPRQLSFADPWTPFTLQYARATLAAAGGREVLASVMIEEAGLGNWTAIEQWLDVATTVDVAGYYLIIGRHGDYPTAWDPQLLSHLARLVYRLSVLNDYQVVGGYADLPGLVLVAAGASAVASGWSYRQRQFVTDRWIPRKGGQPASPRVTSSGLITPILATGEGEASCRSRVADRVIPDAVLRARIATNPRSWANHEAQLQHLEVLSDLVREVEKAGSIVLRLDRLAEMLSDARAIRDALSREGVSLASGYSTSLASLSAAITSMRRDEGV